MSRQWHRCLLICAFAVITNLVFSRRAESVNVTIAELTVDVNDGKLQTEDLKASLKNGVLNFDFNQYFPDLFPQKGIGTGFISTYDGADEGVVLTGLTLKLTQPGETVTASLHVVGDWASPGGHVREYEYVEGFRRATIAGATVFDNYVENITPFLGELVGQNKQTFPGPGNLPTLFDPKGPKEEDRPKENINFVDLLYMGASLPANATGHDFVVNEVRTREIAQVVPEPSTKSLALFGLACVALVRLVRPSRPTRIQNRSREMHESAQRMISRPEVTFET